MSIIFLHETAFDIWMNKTIIFAIDSTKCVSSWYNG